MARLLGTLAMVWLAAATARAEGGPLDRLTDGAPIYLLVRPAAAALIAQRLGIDKTQTGREMKEQLGVDPTNPALLAPTGIDGSAPIAASLYETDGRGGYFHHRVVATLADAARLDLLLAGMASSPSGTFIVYPEKSPERRAGIRASSSLVGLAILRIADDRVILDDAQPWDGGKVPAPLALAKRFPIDPARPFAIGGGAARALLRGDPPVAFYADGRRLPSLIGPLAVRDATLSQPPGASRKRGVEVARREAAACARDWTTPAPIFDDAAVTLAGDAKNLTATIAFGDVAGHPLRLPLADDAPLDLARLTVAATASASFTLAGFSSLQKLPRVGAIADLSALQASAGRCGKAAGATALVRHWPQLAGLLLLDELASNVATIPSLEALLSRVRNVTVLLRDVREDETRYAIAATFAPGARPALEMAFASAGAPEVLTFGGRTPGVYPLTLAGLSRGVLAIEDLPSGRTLAVAADGSPTLEWTYSGRPGPPDPQPAIARFRLDTQRAAPLLTALLSPGEANGLLDALVRAGSIDGRLTDEGDRIQLTLSAPVK